MAKDESVQDGMNEEELQTEEQLDTALEAVDVDVKTEVEPEPKPDEEPPAPPEEEESAAEDETAKQVEEATVKVEKRVVPEAVFLEQKRKRQDAERELAELRAEKAKAEESQIGPTTKAEFIKAKGLKPAEYYFTAEDDLEIEANQQKKQALQSKSVNITESDAIVNQFRSTITEQHQLLGLGFDDVFTKDNFENLSIRDQREIAETTAPRSLARTSLIYVKLIERNPVLKALQVKFNKTKTKQKLPGTKPNVQQARTTAKNVPTQNDILAAVNAGKTEDEIFRDVGA